MTCSDCIHVYVCENAFCWIDPNDSNKKTTCVHFKPKSRYIELPCAVGDKVYWWNMGGNLTEAEVARNCITAKIECGFEYDISYDEIGKTVFLTKEEAEKALKEKQQ